MRILITGAAGFIGSHLAERLLEQGHEVVGIDDLSTGRIANFPSDEQEWRGAGELLIGDIRDPLETVIGDVRSGWDAIYHCAASYRDRNNWERDASTNVLGTINVIREAKRTDARLIYFQTSLCYGPNPASPIMVDAPLDPRGSYAVSKTAGETYIRDSGLSFVSLRLANMYGPRNLSGPAPTFFKRLEAGEPCTVVDSRRDFVYIDDLINVAAKALTAGTGIYHVSSGTDTSIAELYDAVGHEMGVPFDAPTLVPRGPDDVATLLLDPSETYQEFNWRAKTPLIDGIAVAVKWYQRHGVSETFTHLSMGKD